MTMEQTEQIDTTSVGTEPVAPVEDVPGEVPSEEVLPTQPEGEASVDSAPPTVQDDQPTGETPLPPPTPQYSPEQIEQMQRTTAQYEQAQASAALKQQSDSYKEQLESQGYLPEQAQQITDQFMRMQVENANISSRADQFGRHIQEKQLTVEHFVKTYNLGIDDMTTLRTYNDPKSMEAAAKQLSTNRQRDAELASFKKARVPSQSFDNSQGNPQVAADEGSWLDRYNAGDRSPSAAAAAKRAAGIG
jgi:hypothetical protein